MGIDNQEILGNFEANIKSVRELANFDHIVLEFAIGALKDCRDKLKSNHGIDNPYLVPANALKNLQNVRSNDSLRPRYEDMFNQCVVLVVSYLAFSLEELFVANVPQFIPNVKKPAILSEEIRISISDIQVNGWDISSSVGEWIVRKKNISFQDMQSIRRTFSDYFDIDMPRDEDMNNIVFAQASRHVIVHRGGVIGDRFLQQTKDAMPRRVKPDCQKNGVLRFSEADIAIIADSMARFVRALVCHMGKALETEGGR